jgi:hypothetical protein
MEEGCLNANVIFDEIKAQGYTGGKTILRTFMQPLRPAVLTKATVRFETSPGHQAQVDWGRFRVDWNGEPKRLYAFVMVLGYWARTKGKVENGIGYVRKNFWPRVQTFTGLDDLNRQVRRWLDTVANVREHGTTREIPRARWLREGLKPLNPMPFEEVDKQARKVSSDACVSYENNRYSVPFEWVGQIVHIQDLKNGKIRIYHGERLLAEHPKAAGKYQRVINEKHFEGLTATGKHKVPQPMPRLVPKAIPEVLERDLSVYEQFTDEAVVQR